MICPSKRFLDLECPGCGLTQATQHFLHGEGEVALNSNPLVVVVVPILLAVVWVVQLVVLARFFWAYRAIQRKAGARNPSPLIK